MGNHAVDINVTNVTDPMQVLSRRLQDLVSELRLLHNANGRAHFPGVHSKITVHELLVLEVLDPSGLGPTTWAEPSPNTHFHTIDLLLEDEPFLFSRLDVLRNAFPPLKHVDEISGAVSNVRHSPLTVAGRLRDKRLTLLFYVGGG